MSLIGIDLEQFIRDPYATGIQRVLQQLAVHWPQSVDALFAIPDDDGCFLLITPDQAAALLTLPFDEHRPASAGSDANHDLRMQVTAAVAGFRADRSIPRVRLSQLLSIIDGWLLPEVSYLPSVLERAQLFGRGVPVTMIGYDTLPMTEPANYRFVPGTASHVSEYFRLLATVDSVVCISAFARDTVLDRLRRDRAAHTTIAHPGGDHLPVRTPHTGVGRPRFVRLGTMEARKRPLEILHGFLSAVDSGLDAELVFIGNPNASAASVNDQVRAAVESGRPVSWIQGASDQEVHELVHEGDAFLSIGVEGYGIPVLEAIRLGTPVIYDGIQPAGELMEGRGARRLAAHSDADLAAMFTTAVRDGVLDQMRSQLDPNAVPTWRDFAHRVAASCTGGRIEP